MKRNKDEKAKGRTIGHVLADLCPEGISDDLWRWPPNAFAVTGVLLAESGAYRLVVDPHPGEFWPPKNYSSPWKDHVATLAGLWRQWFADKKPPSEITTLLTKITGNPNLAIAALTDPKEWALTCKLLEIHAVSDLASAGLGMPPDNEDNTPEFWFYGNGLLSRRHTLSNFDTSRIKILPKLRTPQVGISLRSLSHHLCIDRSEVQVDWLLHPGPLLPKEMTLNLLLLPWPLEVDPSDFQLRNWTLENIDPDKFGFFEFDPPTKFDLKYAEKALKDAKAKTKEIHGVILPEAALNEAELKKLERLLAKNEIGFYIAGIRERKRNFARLGLHSRLGPGMKPTYFPHDQDKHHRWLLDGSQIRNYHLGSVFHPNRRYWEGIEVRRRTVDFLCLTNWLTMCHLICEDLARHDPVSHVVRGVGPNLVVALLLDGPQLNSRWPSRYASVLAEDPGSSVLTVTSLGMATRSRPKGEKISRVVALWKDAEYGTREIELDSGKTAVVLSLTARFQTEWTADGREDEESASVLSLAGYQQV